MSLGKSFLAATIAAGNVGELLQHGPIEHLFKGNETQVFAFVKEFIKEYGALPTPDTIHAHTGEELPDAKEPPGYYRDLMSIRHTEITLKSTMKAMQEQLQPGAAGADKALQTMTEAVMALMRSKYAAQVADFRDAYDLLIGEYVTKKAGLADPGLMLGWPYLDEMTGGLRSGDLVSYVGRPATGKTWQLLYAAHSGWLKAELDPESKGSSRMFVSMEMNVLAIEQRLAALHLSMPAFQVKNSIFSTPGIKKFKKGLTEIQGYKQPFWVVDGNLTSTVEDIHLLAKQFKPDAIFIDGAYLLAHAKAKDRYARVAENCDLVKKNLAPLAPTVCSWQFKRPEKKKKGEDVDLEDIGYSDAIGQHSSLVLGLFEEETVETLKQRRVKVLKGRNGETGSFVTNFRFDTMDFAQVEDVALEDMQF